MIQRRWRVPAGMLFCLSFIFLQSCFQSSEIIQDTKHQAPFAGRLLVLPFQDVSEIYGQNVSIRCQVCGKVFTAGEVRPGAARFLTERLGQMLDRPNEFELIPASQAQGVISSLLRQSERELRETELYIRTGRALGADAVLAGYVHQFRDREGTDYSVALPSSVAFHLDMIRVADGRIVWSGQFNETQQSLSEDLFQLGKFLKRKGRWISVEDLAVYGLEQILRNSPLI